MDGIVLFFLALGLVTVLLSWMLPHRLTLSFISAATFLGLLVWSPYSAISLLLLSVTLPLFMQHGGRVLGKNATLFIAICAVSAIFVTSRLSQGLAWIGVAYFSLRLIHVLIEWWIGKIAIPSVTEHLKYQFFAPVIVAGPINRMPHFQREWDRRSWDSSEFWSGFERFIIGMFLVIVVGSALLGKVERSAELALKTHGFFLQQWVGSAIDWIQLYTSFSGYTSIALGLGLMMGIKLEENFNKPYLASNLIDFWSRWHMTLTSWCRDYVFKPLSAATRNPALGVFAAMLVLGLWHEFSIYYVLWAAWQSLGIIATHLLKDKLPDFSAPVGHVGGAIIVFSWLTLAQPVIRTLLSFV